MSPEEALREQFESVKRALYETLRYDYGPDSTRDYYEECANRLSEIEKAIPRTKPTEIWARLNELSYLSIWISLIERSRLGEFSWPFAEQIRNIAKPLLSEPTLGGAAIEPIVHVVAEGEGYQIFYEKFSSPSVRHRFAIVAFPRPLKHHVLLHTIFGHELGHTAQDTPAAGTMLRSEVRAKLSAAGPLSGVSTLNSWIRDPASPSEVKAELSSFYSNYGSTFAFQDYYHQKWVEEFICDLFGLMLFGPGFAAAHQALLRPSHRTPYDIELIDPTHPPYAVRHKMIAQAMRLLGWDQPSIGAANPFHEAEKAALQYITDDPYAAWASIFADDQLRKAIDGVRNVLSAYGSFGYRKPHAKEVAPLVGRLVKRLPPITAKLDAGGNPKLVKVQMAHALYAGWVYWLGRKKLGLSDTLSFLETNKLCDHALLQERAIEITA